MPPIEQIEPRVLLSTYTVNTVSDAVNAGPGLVSLRLAVAKANTVAGADTINFDPKVFTPNVLHTITLLNGPMNFSDLTGATTIVGPGPNIVAINGSFNTSGGQATNTRDLVIAAGATASVSGVRIIGGSDPNGGPGGGVFNAGTLTLQNVLVKNNFAHGFQNLGTQMPAPGAGGGIFSVGSLKIINSTVTSNSADGFDASGSGGGIYSAGPTTIQNSTITANSSSGDSGKPAFGAGIYATGSLVINSSVVSSNEADGGSGSDVFDYPASDASGGGIYCRGTLSITSSTLQKNTAKGGGEFGGSGTNGGNARGGAIFANGTNSKIVSSQITGNAAKGAPVECTVMTAAATAAVSMRQPPSPLTPAPSPAIPPPADNSARGILALPAAASTARPASRSVKARYPAIQLRASAGLTMRLTAQKATAAESLPPEV